MRAIVAALRPHQWAKNALVFAAAGMAHQLQQSDTLVRTLLAFIAFCCAASAGYIVNDILDIAADRMHPRKRLRPIASGRLSVPMAWGIMAILMAGAIICSTILGLPFFGMLVLYVVGTLTYSSVLKRFAIMDVVVLSGLYTIRLSAGGIAANVYITAWLYAFSLFLFTSLAFMKRYVELRDTPADEMQRMSRRGYRLEDAGFLAIAGPMFGSLSILVLALYINAPQVRQLYVSPWILWMLVPVFIYWMSTMWLVAHRGEMHDDPVAHAIRDPVSICTGVVSAGILIAASW